MRHLTNWLLQNSTGFIIVCSFLIGLLPVSVYRSMANKSSQQNGCTAQKEVSYQQQHSTISNTSQNQHELLLNEVRKTVPPLTYNSHKGQAGRIGIIGGCEE